MSKRTKIWAGKDNPLLPGERGRSTESLVTKSSVSRGHCTGATIAGNGPHDAQTELLLQQPYLQGRRSKTQACKWPQSALSCYAGVGRVLLLGDGQCI